MTDARLINLAKILVQYSIEAQPGDWVLVNTSPNALPLAREVLRQLIRAGAHTNVLLRDDEIEEIHLNEASEDQLKWISPLQAYAIERVDATINLNATSNTRTMSQVDPAKVRLMQQARKSLFEKYMLRAAEGKLRWVVTNYPCHAFAQDADMSLHDYESFVYQSTFADQDDPIQAWKDMHSRQQRLVDWLQGKNQVEIKGPNCQLSLSISRRSFLNSDGKKNMPDGEIFTGPVEDSAYGWVKFTYPAIHGSREVEGVELVFRSGNVIEANASKNKDYLLTLLDSDPGARYLGEFAFGTNYGIKRFTKNILYDEKIAGTFHLAVGSGYPETGSKNRSSIHWDFICDLSQDSEVLVDGELFYKNGDFVI